MSKGSCDPLESSQQVPCSTFGFLEREAHYGAGLLTFGDPHWSNLFLKDLPQMKGSMLEQFMKNCSLWEELKFVKDCLLCEGPCDGTGEELWSVLSSKEERAVDEHVRGGGEDILRLSFNFSLLSYESFIIFSLLFS